MLDAQRKAKNLQGLPANQPWRKIPSRPQSGDQRYPGHTSKGHGEADAFLPNNFIGAVTIEVSRHIGPTIMRIS